MCRCCQPYQRKQAARDSNNLTDQEKVGFVATASSAAGWSPCAGFHSRLDPSPTRALTLARIVRPKPMLEEFRVTLHVVLHAAPADRRWRRRRSRRVRRIHNSTWSSRLPAPSHQLNGDFEDLFSATVGRHRSQLAADCIALRQRLRVLLAAPGTPLRGFQVSPPPSADRQVLRRSVRLVNSSRRSA